MGKYTIREDWPDDLKVAAGDVIRAKLARKWRKHRLMKCSTVSQFRAEADYYVSADHILRQRKAHFDDLYLKFQEAGEATPR